MESPPRSIIGKIYEFINAEIKAHIESVLEDGFSIVELAPLRHYDSSGTKRRLHWGLDDEEILEHVKEPEGVLNDIGHSEATYCSGMGLQDLAKTSIMNTPKK